MKLVTILFLLKENKILLAMKKRGFGVGKWNGVGGKADAGENEYQAAIRECQEEIGVTPINPKLVGKLKFYDQNDRDFGHHAHIFVAKAWLGQPMETEEMRPQWFDVSDIPYKQMWADDIFWLPHLLAGRLFVGSVTLDGESVASHHIKVVTSLAETE